MIHTRIKFNVDVLLSHTFTDENYDFIIYNLSNYTDFYTEEDANELRFEMRNNVNQKFVYVNLEYGSPEDEFYNNEILNISDNGQYFVCDCDFADADIPNLLQLINWGIIELDFDGKTSLITYHQNSENDVIQKSITPVSIIQGKFNHSIGLKNINIDLENFYDNQFNYVYIPKLNRYYYVDFIELISVNITRLHLKEDVLMSWESLIRTQNAFVTRFEQSGEIRLVDSRKPLEDIITNSELSVTDTPTNESLVNIEFNYGFAGNNEKPNIIVTTQSTTNSVTRSSPLPAPSNSGLPAISTQLNDLEYVRFIKPEKLFYLSKAYMSSSAYASFIASALWLPFDTTNAFDLETDSTIAIRVNDKYIDSTGAYVTSGTPLTCYASKINSNIDGKSPYLIAKDFTYSVANDSFNLHEPYTNYEIYLPFVGWVKLDSQKFFNKRILIYYTMDLKTGLSTAYIYNYTDKYVIWSGTCQIGIKIDLSTTNIEENIRQKQANDLNMLLGLVGSGLSIGVGAMSNNPVAIAGGVLSASKVVAGYVNANNQIFERAQMGYGTPNGALYSNKEIIIRKYEHKPLVINESIYKHIQGLPYNQYLNLNAFGGGLYVEVGEIHFNPNGENIYQDEISEIVDLLQNGVIF